MRNLLALLCAILLLGSAQASVALRMDDGAVLLEENGAEIVSFGTYSDIAPLGVGLFAAVQEGKTALMDASGSLCTDFVFDHILRKDDLLLGSVSGKWCILNPDGSPRTDAVYGMIVPNGLGGAWAIHGTGGDVASDELLVIDENGAEISTGLYIRSMADIAGDGLIAVQPSDSFSYIYCNAQGQPAFDASFETAGSFSGGAAAVTGGGSFGVIAPDGSFILPAEYSFAAVSESGLILAVNESGVYACGADGKLIPLQQGENLSAAFVSEAVQVYDGEKLNVYSPDGTLLHELAADASVIAGLNGQLIISDGFWGEECVYLSGTEKSYQNLNPLGFADGEAVYAFMEVPVAKYMNNLLGEVQFSADMDAARYGIASAEGEMLLPAVYARIEAVADDRFLVRTETQWRMIDSGGRSYWKMDAEPLSQD